MTTGSKNPLRDARGGHPNGRLERARGIRAYRADPWRVIADYPWLDASLIQDLTPTECHVLLMVLDGCTNREIAVARGTSVRTVANQVASIFHKKRVHARADLVALASVNGKRR